MIVRVCVLLACAGGLFAQEAAVREVVSKYVAARIAGDEAAIRALFTPDADQLVSNGEWRRGRDELTKGTLAASKREAGQARSITVETVRFLTPDVAIADGPYHVGDRKMQTCLLIVRGKDGWHIAAIRNMLPSR